jgi:signal transduction histidine kinase
VESGAVETVFAIINSDISNYMPLSEYDIKCITKAKALIDADFSIHYSVEHIAAVAGIGAAKLKKGFKEHYNSSLYTYRRTQHIVQAADNLCTELHDNIGQLLSTAKMFIGIAERQFEKPPLTLLSANETLDKAINELRNLSKSLNKDWMEQFDLYRSLSADIVRINTAGALNIQLTRSGHLLHASSDQQFIFYRLLQEGIQNVIKHAAARHLYISIGYDKSHIRAILQDDGIGFNTKQQPTGLGIRIMKQRVKVLGGSINWQSYLPGTKLTIVFPIKKAIL